MKTRILNIAVFAISVLLFVVGACSNSVEPTEEIVEIKEKLLGKYWGMYQEIFVSIDSAILPPSPTATYYLEQGEVNYQEQVKEKPESYLPIYFFEDKIMKDGYSYYGIVRYNDDNLPYTIYKDSLNAYWIDCEVYGTQEPSRIYHIVKLDDEELVLEQFYAQNVQQFNYLRTLKSVYYFKSRDFAPLMEKYNNISSHLIGKWIQLEQHTTIEYFEGYSSEAGLTHIDNTVTYTSSYPYLEITSDNGFRTGTYTDGKIEYYVAPDAPTGNNGLRTLSESLDADGNFHLNLHAYFKDNSNAYYIVDNIDEQTLIMHIPISEFITEDEEQVQTCEGKKEEIWKRIK